jgi:aconitate hydratase
MEIKTLRDKLLDSMEFQGKTYFFYNLNRLENDGLNIRKMPFSLRVLLENVIRKYDGKFVKDEHI